MSAGAGAVASPCCSDSRKFHLVAPARPARQGRDELGERDVDGKVHSIRLHPLALSVSSGSGSLCCQCVAGCPSGAKQAVRLSVLPAACAAGARVVTRARATRASSPNTMRAPDATSR